MKRDHVLATDQGTTSTNCLIVGRKRRVKPSGSSTLLNEEYGRSLIDVERSLGWA